MMNVLLFAGAFVVVSISAAMNTVAAAAAPNVLPLPSALPKAGPTITLKNTCDDSERPAVVSMLSRLRAKPENDGTAFRETAYKGTGYILINPKKAGITLSAFLACVDTYVGTSDEARKLDLYVPGDDIPVGVIIYMPALGFYMDPRAWKPLGKH